MIIIKHADKNNGRLSALLDEDFDYDTDYEEMINELTNNNATFRPSISGTLRSVFFDNYN